MRLAALTAVLAIALTGCDAPKAPPQAKAVQSAAPGSSATPLGKANILWPGVLDIALSPRSSPEACVRSVADPKADGGHYNGPVEVSFRDAKATDCVSVTRGAGERTMLGEIDAKLLAAGWRRTPGVVFSSARSSYEKPAKGGCERIEMIPFDIESVEPGRRLWVGYIKDAPCEPGK
jgi:hypothetical protein